ncbi:MAG: phage tail protein [Pseudomonadota bacterium]|nr:phage tail protein [Pseudomonadota bacterium]
MSNPYLSEIRLMSFNYAPKGWALCNGQTLPIQQNQALFSLLGTFYGGDGITTFKLPNLQGCVPIHYGSDPVAGVYSIGQTGGEAAHTLTIAETPAHSHTLSAIAANAANITPAPTDVLAQAFAIVSGGTTPVSIYATGSPNATFAPGALGAIGGQPHANQQPYLTLNFCISLQGIFPSRN